MGHFFPSFPPPLPFYAPLEMTIGRNQNTSPLFVSILQDIVARGQGEFFTRLYQCRGDGIDGAAEKIDSSSSKLLVVQDIVTHFIQ